MKNEEQAVELLVFLAILCPCKKILERTMKHAIASVRNKNRKR